jgi:hypothetical protein
MSQPIELAVDTYIRAWNERDRAVRQMMVDECFAADGRFVTRLREVRGRAALVELMSQLMGAPEVLGIRVTSAVDAQGTTFRFRAVVDHRDGTSQETFEAGEIDAKGRISLILTFPGPLLDVAVGVSDGQTAQ